MGGEAKSITRKLEELSVKSDELDKAVDAFLVEGNEAAAVASQSRLNSTARLVETFKEQLERQEVEYRQTHLFSFARRK